MAKKIINKKQKQRRVRMKISGVSDKPRLSVFRSAKYIYAQLIDDENGKTLVSAKSSEVKASKSKETKLEKKCLESFETGKLLAKRAIEKKIEKVIFDRGERKYHGRVKSLAEGAREGGLKF